MFVNVAVFGLSAIDLNINNHTVTDGSTASLQRLLKNPPHQPRSPPPPSYGNLPLFCRPLLHVFCMICIRLKDTFLSLVNYPTLTYCAQQMTAMTGRPPPSLSVVSIGPHVTGSAPCPGHRRVTRGVTETPLGVTERGVTRRGPRAKVSSSIRPGLRRAGSRPRVIAAASVSPA